MPPSAMLVSDPTPMKSLRPSGLGNRLRVQWPPPFSSINFRPGAVMRFAPAV
jgi:hypothetical protein